MGYNKITLHGKQICDYMYIQSAEINPNSFETVDSEPIEWVDDTVLFAKFNNDLVAGDSSITDSIKGYEVRKRIGANSYSEYVATIKDGGNKYLVDYLVANNTSYQYLLYSSGEETTAVPFISEDVVPKFQYWSLLVVDETEEENVYTLNKLFKFELNIQSDDMNNNSAITVNSNFTRYPTVQYSTSNYWSSSLTSLCGYIDCSNMSYAQTPNMINELKELTSDTRKKFLKDIEGNIWEIKISAPINISNNDNSLQQIKSVKVSWVEVGEVENISVINDPNKSSVEWLLTSTGNVVPYASYVWDEMYKWDNSYKWTAQNDILSVGSYSNMGRNLFEEEGE